jgi:hypothetical protein
MCWVVGVESGVDEFASAQGVVVCDCGLAYTAENTHRVAAEYGAPEGLVSSACVAAFCCCASALVCFGCTVRASAALLGWVDVGASVRGANPHGFRRAHRLRAAARTRR